MNELGNFLMVKQFRPNLNIQTLEFPAGEIESGETPNQAAAREIREELGVGCEMIQLGSYHLMMNRTNINNYLFFCVSNYSLEPSQPEKGIESIEISRDIFKQLLTDKQYLQLAGLGIIQLASMALKVDLLNAPVEVVLEAFNNHLDLI